MSNLIYPEESYKTIGARFKLGLLVNFGHHPKLEWERIVL